MSLIKKELPVFSEAAYYVPTGGVPRLTDAIPSSVGTPFPNVSCGDPIVTLLIGSINQLNTQQFPGTVRALPQTPPMDLSKLMLKPIVEPAKHFKHSHYFKDVSKLKVIDVYRVLSLFEVTDPALAHAIKKLLVAGGRGAGKSIEKDVQEAIDTLMRYQEMNKENNA